ncbi:MAG: M23 family metallopeptidase [Bacteroidetes bacterium]|nr:M23 family metallopeptidase [Bacteroidota bacterium]
MVTHQYKGWKKLNQWLKIRYRLVILNDTTFGEKISLRLTPYRLLIGLIFITIVMTILVISLVAFTPLREYIPGYGSVAERKLILELNNKTDSIEQSLSAKDFYLTNILNVLNEKTEGKSEKPKKDTTGKYNNIKITASQADKKFRDDFEKNAQTETTFLNSPQIRSLTNIAFFCPLKGLLIDSFNLEKKHLGVDIVGKASEVIKATLDGTIIFTGFTPEDGFIIQIQHSNNIISIYKHCSSLLKSIGDKVKSGEAIALVGNTGTHSKGYRLHFEVWHNGSVINPQFLIAF